MGKAYNVQPFHIHFIDGGGDVFAIKTYQMTNAKAASSKAWQHNKTLCKAATRVEIVNNHDVLLRYKRK